MNIVAVLMLKNENRLIPYLNKRNPPYTMLEQCLSKVAEIADGIIIIDNGSTDGSQEVYNRFANKILEIKYNLPDLKFNDIRDRSWLLEKASETKAKFMLQVDGDEVHEDAGIKWIKDYAENNASPVQILFPFINLWRSRDRYRTDKWNNSKQPRMWYLPDLRINGGSHELKGIIHSYAFDYPFGYPVKVADTKVI